MLSFIIFLLLQSHIDKSNSMSMDSSCNFWTQNVEGLTDSEVPTRSACILPSANLSIFFDYPLILIGIQIQLVPSNDPDITHFLRKPNILAGSLPRDSIMITFDARSQYTNRPYDKCTNNYMTPLSTFCD